MSQQAGLAVAIRVRLAANVLAPRMVHIIVALRDWRFWWPHPLPTRQRPTRMSYTRSPPSRMREPGW